LDQVAIRRINGPEGKAQYGPLIEGKMQHATSCFLKEALDRGAEQFKWKEKVARTPKQIGSKVRGVGVSLSVYVGGTIGFDGLLIVKPDGRVTFQSGIGNLGTESVSDVHRVAAEILGRSTLGIGHAIGQKWVFDPHYGAMVSTRFYQNKPPTILDVPINMQWGAVDIPDPETPVGARGIGEPPVGGGCASILNALSDALGDEIFQRAPVNLDTILSSLEAGRPMQHPLTAHI
jgi:CO/xanthine dehydrogenase Mo-binding subunit